MNPLVFTALIAGCASTTVPSENPPPDADRVSIPTPVQPPPMQLVLADLTGVVNGRWVNKNTAVGGSVEPQALSQLAADGIERIINLRGTAELTGEEEQQARSAGLAFVHLPVTGLADLTPEFLRELDDLLGENTPTLIHCASGNRVGAAFALHAKAFRGATAEEALELGKRHGLTSMEAAVRSRLAAEGAP